MPSHPGDLPDYAQPPVVEVALAIQFKSAIGYRSLDLAKFAEHWSETLPKALERPPLGPMAAEFESPAVALRLSEETETPRLWLLDEKESRVLQLQQDRLVVNWRKLPSDAPYPHYESIRGFLVEAWGQMTSVLHDLGHSVPEPSICEVLYVNHLDERSGWGSVSDTSEIIAPWGGSMSDDFLPAAREAAFSLLFELPDGGGQLAVNGGSGQLDNGRKAMTLHLISRGRAVSPDLEGALDFMDLAHEWIVRGLTSFTTPEVQKRWHRTK